MALLDDYFTKKALADELDCSERTISRYEVTDGLPVTLLGRRPLYHKASVREWLARRERRPNARKRRAGR